MGGAGRALRDAWMAKFADYHASTTSWPTSSIGCNGASCRTAGIRICPSSRPTPRASPAGTPRAQVLNALAAAGALADGRRGRLCAVDQDAADLRRRGRFSRRDSRPDGTSTLVCASTPWAPSSMVLPSPRSAPFGSGFLIFSDYGARLASPVGADGDPGHLRLHPRFHRRGRGRANAPARRAPCLATGHSRALSPCGRATPTR